MQSIEQHEQELLKFKEYLKFLKNKSIQLKREIMQRSKNIALYQAQINLAKEQHKKEFDKGDI